MLSGRTPALLLFLTVLVCIGVSATWVHAIVVNCDETPTHPICEAIRASEGTAVGVPATTGIPSGARRATDADRAAIEAAGLPYTPGMLWDPDNTDVGTSPGKAKQFLKDLPRGFAGSSAKDCKTYEDKNIEKLNPDFAVCAAKFLKAYSNKYGVVTITSAYRDGKEAKCVCIGEKGMCGYLPVDAQGYPIGGRGIGHQFGTAIDVWPFTPEEVLRYSEDRSPPVQEKVMRFQNFAHSNPQFGVHFTYGMLDRPHLEPTGKGCSSATPKQEADSRSNQQSTAPFGLGDTFRRVAGLGQQPQSPAQQQSAAQSQIPPPSQQALPSNQQPFQNMPQPTLISNLITATSGISVPFPDLYTAPTSTIKKTLAIDLLDSLANQASQQTQTETAPLVLTIDGSEAHTLVQDGVQQSVPFAPHGDSYQLTPGAQQTFISGDLSQSLGAYIQSPQQTSALQAILTSMRETLLRALEYLRPFGRPRSDQYGEYL